MSTRGIDCMTHRPLHADAAVVRRAHAAPMFGRLLALALMALLCLAASASARTTHFFSASFGTPGTGDGELALVDGSHAGGASGVALDTVGGAVYVVDTGNSRVQKFDLTGGYQAQFGTAGAGAGQFTDPTGIAIDNSGVLPGAIYVLDHGNNRIEKFTAAGAYSAQLTGTPGGPFGELYGVATDAAGHLWVYQASAEIDEFAADGTFLQSFYCPCGAAPGLAVNDNGLVFSGGFSGMPSVTDGAAGGSYLGDVPTGAAATGIAAAPGGDVYVAEGTVVEQFAAATPVAAAVDSFGGGHLTAGGAIAVGATGTAYVTDGGANAVAIFTPVDLATADTEAPTALVGPTATLNATVSADSPPASAVTDCHFDYVADDAFRADIDAGHDGYTDLSSGGAAPCTALPTGTVDTPVHADVTGLVGGTLYHARISVTNGDGTALGDSVSFGAPGQPVIADTGTVALTIATARLRATIDPVFAATTYHVEYGATASDGSATAESGSVGADHSVHPIRVTLAGLAPATTYHWRLVATNAAGTTVGPDQTFVTPAAATAPAPCANDALRSGPGARLPDCRAYEQASPTDKHGGSVTADSNLSRAASQGDRVTFADAGGQATTGGSSSPPVYVASRGADGWTSNGLLPVTDPSLRVDLLGWDDTLRGVLNTRPARGGGALSLGDITAGTAADVFPIPSYFFASLAAFAGDTAHATFETDSAALTADASVGVSNLYDLDHGAVTLAGRIPAGAGTACDDVHGPACVPAPDGSFAGAYSWQQGYGTGYGGASYGHYTARTLSADGTRAVFTARNSGQLYVRSGNTRTVRVSASQAATPDPNGAKPAAWVDATPGVDHVLFLSCEKLTDDATAVSTGDSSCTTADQGQDLYRYDMASGRLTDLSVDTDGADAKGAQVIGVFGVADDGDDAYFVANGVLAPGATPGTCQIGSLGGACNLYVSHGGAITFVARLSAGSDGFDWTSFTDAGNDTIKTSRVGPDGTVLFSSRQRLTDFDPAEATVRSCAGDSCAELYRYRVGDAAPTCVSCNPTGVPPIGDAVLATRRNAFNARPKTSLLTRNISADGNRVFFDTGDALVAQDTNGLDDVYQWEAPGTGSCVAAQVNGGCVSLLSTGTSPDPSYYGDSSISGDDVFVFTSQPLVPGDADQLVDVYDVRVGGGLASQHAVVAAGCAGDACQGVPAAAPAGAVAASLTFVGPDNPTPDARPGPTARPKVTKPKAIRGTSATLAVKVPARGKLRVSGSGLRTATKATTKSATYKVTVALTSRARATLKRKRSLTVKTTVVFTPTSGAPSTATLTLTFKTPTTKKGR